jgi:hypothetical protein
MDKLAIGSSPAVSLLEEILAPLIFLGVTVGVLFGVTGDLRCTELRAVGFGEAVGLAGAGTEGGRFAEILLGAEGQEIERLNIETIDFEHFILAG